MMNRTIQNRDAFPWRAVGGGLVAMFLAFGVGRFAYTPLLPLMRDQAGLALDQAGYLASLMYLGYLSGSVLVTKILARCGAVRALSCGLLILVLGTWTMTFGNTFPFWALVMFTIGAASAAIFLAALSLVLGVFLDYGAGWLTAFLYVGIGAAIVLLGLVVPELGAESGWQSAWRFVSVTAATGALVCFFLLLPGQRQKRDRRAHASGREIPGARRSIHLLLIAYALHGFSYTIGGTFMVAMLAALPGVSGQAHLGWVLVGAMVIPSCVVWPLVAARVGEVRITAVLMFLLAVANLTAVFWSARLGVLIAAGTFGSTFLAIPGLVLSRLGRLAGSRKDEIAGFATIIFGVAMVLGPSFAGLVARATGSFDWALGLASGALFLASFTCLLAERATKIPAAAAFDVCPYSCR
ncbi:MAG: hypothetical protein C0622_00430 [Desulfuromonas sp.]|nr:MAG: hypothetical protein C0622_00430 [Desulfuromonas sp.]